MKSTRQVSKIKNDSGFIFFVIKINFGHHSKNLYGRFNSKFLSFVRVILFACIHWPLHIFSIHDVHTGLFHFDLQAIR